MVVPPEKVRFERSRRRNDKGRRCGGRRSHRTATDLLSDYHSALTPPFTIAGPRERPRKTSTPPAGQKFLHHFEQFARLVGLGEIVVAAGRERLSSSPLSANDVSATIGMWRSSSRALIRRAASSPEMRGSWMSIRMISGRSRAATATPPRRPRLHHPIAAGCSKSRMIMRLDWIVLHMQDRLAHAALLLLHPPRHHDVNVEPYAACSPPRCARRASSTKRLTMARPEAGAAELLGDLPDRRLRNSSKMDCSSSGGMPTPVSRDDDSEVRHRGADPDSHLAAAVNLIALPTRLRKTWHMRRSSP